MERRDFLAQVAAWSAVSATIPLFDASAILAAETPAVGESTVAIAKGKDYGALVTQVISKLGGMAAFVKSGDKVVIKPNIGWDRSPEQGANTHPDVVKALVKLALDQGAKQVLVFDRSANDARRCYRNSGIQAAIESIHDPRARCIYLDDQTLVPVQLKNAKVLQEWPIYRDALEADCYINVPIAKHHGMAKLTLGLKNVMGVIGGPRGKIHQQIAEKLTDLNLVLRPKLTVIDATRILLRSGPQGGKIEDVKVTDTLIASRDIVAADACATGLFGHKPADIDSIVAAHNRGMGQMNLEKIRILEA